MKITKGLLLFGLVLGVSSCFETPEFDDVPKISLDDLYFGVANANSSNGLDSVVLSIKFQDGDGDLGLEATVNRNPSHFSDPFNASFFHLESDGDLIPISTYVGVTDENAPRYFNPVLNLDSDQTGILATLRTKDKPEYQDENLPDYVIPDRCGVYISDSVYILGDDIRIIDNSFPNVEEIPGFNPPLYKVKDIFYIKKNPDTDNIKVTWLKKVPNGSFVEINWQDQNFTQCTLGYDSRFQVVSKSKGPIEGIIRYSMKSSGFSIVLNNEKLKLRVQIKDRALHQSNIIETDEFTLSGIRK